MCIATYIINSCNMCKFIFHLACNILSIKVCEIPNYERNKI